MKLTLPTIRAVIAATTLACLSASLAFAGIPGLSRIVTTTYSDWDVPVVTYDLENDYSANDLQAIYSDPTVTWTQINTAQVSAVPLLEFALYEADPNNSNNTTWGGIVYLPAGEYLIDDQISIPETVCLRGDWDDPSDGNMAVNGTVLYITHGAGSEYIDDYTILLESASCVSDLSVYYPYQDDISQLIPYTWTFRGSGQFNEIRNVTLVNPYKGMTFEPMNGGAVGRCTIRNVYGSPLFTGLHIHGTSATPRTLNTKFNPNYWANSGLGYTPNANDIKSAIYDEDGTGFLIGDGDGGGLLASIEATGYATGLENTHESSTRVFDFLFSDCQKGIELAMTKRNGWSFTSGEVKDSTIRAVVLQNKCQSVRFNNVDFSSDNDLIRHKGGHASFVKCNFLSWDDDKAISSNNSNPNRNIVYALQVEGCEFGETTGIGSNYDVNIGGGLKRAIILGNTITNFGTISVNDNTGNAEVIVNANQSGYTNMPDVGKSYTFANRQMPTGTVTLYDVTDASYGATGDGATDDTVAIQAAIDAANTARSSTDDGVVIYFPAGGYRINDRLTVYENMELRGAHNSSFETSEANTFLFLYAGKNDPTSGAIITLAANSGIQGICLYRPEQQYDDFKGITDIYEYPAAIKGTDSNWIYNVALSNCYDGIDFNAGGGHHLDFAYASSINDVIKIRGDGKQSVIENLQVKTMVWRRLRTNTLPAFENNFGGDDLPSSLTDGVLGEIGRGVNYLGNGEFTTFGSFVNRSHQLYKIMGGPKATFINSGGEGEHDTKGYIVRSTSSQGGTGNLDLNIISSSLHTGGTHGNFTCQSGDQIKIFNSKMYYIYQEGKVTNWKIAGNGASIVIQQDFFPDVSDYYLSVHDPLTDALVEGCFFVKNLGYVIYPETRTPQSGDSILKVRGVLVDPKGSNRFSEKNFGGKILFKYNIND